LNQSFIGVHTSSLHFCNTFYDLQKVYDKLALNANREVIYFATGKHIVVKVKNDQY